MWNPTIKLLLVVIYFCFWSIDRLSLAQIDCVDRAHFFYDCAQLAKYCNLSRASGVRASCPQTCGLCSSKSSTSSTVSDRQSTKNSKDAFVTNGKLSGRRKDKPTLDQSTIAARETETVSDAKAASRIRDCCQSRGIGAGCASLCSYQTTKEQAFAKAASGLCTLEDARVFVQCASGGKNNLECCRKNGVVGCEDACSGQLNAEVMQLLTCLSRFLNPILICHRNGLT